MKYAALALFGVTLLGVSAMLARAANETGDQGAGPWRMSIAGQGLFAWRINTTTGHMEFCTTVSGNPPAMQVQDAVITGASRLRH